MALYVIVGAVVLGGGLLVGFVFKWWGLLLCVGFACFLAYGWELDPLGITYAVLACGVSSTAVIVGALLRGKVSLSRIRL